MRIIAELNKVLSKKSINGTLRTLDNTMYVKVLAKLSMTLARKQLKSQLKELNDLYVKVGANVNIDKNAKAQLQKNIKILQQSISDLEIGLKASKYQQNKINAQIKNIRKRAEQEAQRTPISFNLELKKEKLISDIEYLGKRYSKLFSNISSTQKYEKLMGNAMNITDKWQLAEVKTELSAFTSELKANGLATQSTSDKWKTLVERSKDLFSAATLVRVVFSQIRQSVSTFLELDTAMTNVWKVSDDIVSREQFSGLLTKWNKLAQNLSVTTTSLINSISEWSKIGFDLNMSEQLAELTTIFEKTAEISNELANKTLVSTAQAFTQIDGFGEEDYVERVEAVGNKINAIGNKYAISSEGISEALQNSSAALVMANNDLDEAIAMITAGNKIFQSPEEMGNTLKVVSARLRAQKGELEALGEDTEGMIESVSKVQTQILNLTGNRVNIFESDNKTLKSTYDILLEVGRVYNSLFDKDQAELIEIMFGKHRMSAGSSLLLNYEELEQVKNDSINASNSMTREYAKYMESAEASITTFKEKLIETYSVFMSGNMIKFAADTGSAFLDLINSTDLLRHSLLAIATINVGKGISNVGAVVAATTKQMNILGSALEQVENLSLDKVLRTNKLIEIGQATEGLSEKNLKLLLSQKQLSEQEKTLILLQHNLTEEEVKIKLAKMELTSATNNQSKANVAEATTTMTLSGAMTSLKTTIHGVGLAIKASFLSNPIGWILTGITTAVSIGTTVMDTYNKKLEETKQRFDDLKTEVSEIESELSSLNTELQTTVERMKELESQDTLTFTEKEEYDNLVKQNNELQRRIDLLELEQQVKNKEKNKAFVDTMNSDTSNENEYWRDENTGRIHEGNSFWASLGGTLATDSSEEEYINQQFEDRARLLEEKHNAETKEEQDRIQKKIDVIDSYLQSKSSQWTNDASGIDYISNPTTEDDKAVNAWLDFIADFQDRMAIAMGGTNAKGNAFNRLVDNWQFDETVQGLQDLGEQGKVTADMLNDPKYKDFINKLAELGIIDSANNLEDIALAFNKVNESAGQAEEKVAKFFGAFDGSEIGERLQYITQKFNDGELSYREYFEGLQSEIDNIDFSNYTDSLEEANSAAQQFFVDSMQQTASSLSDLFSEFDSGKISITEYLESYVVIGETLSTLTDQLQENSATWNENGEAIDNATSKALDDTQSKLVSAIGVIQSYQDSIYSLEQIMTQSVQVGSEEFSAHAKVIAQDLYNIVQTGGLMADEVAKTLGTTTEEIAQSLTENVSNQSIAAQAISANTNTAITDMATSVGELFDTLGEAISNFKVDITFGVKSITMKEADLGILGNVKLPAVEFGVEASGESLDAIGSAISAFGESVKSNYIPQTIDLEDYLFGNTENAKDYSYTPDSSVLNNYNRALENIKNSQKETAETFNWIKVAVERVQRTITNLGDIVSSTYKKWSTRNNALAQEIYAINEEIALQQKAYNKYMSLSNSVGLSSHYKSLVQNGAIQIDSIKSDSLKEQIKQYQEFYEQALECQDAITELRGELVNLAETKFDNYVSKYENQLSMIEQQTNMINQSMNNMESKGYMVSAVYYDALIDAEQTTLTKLHEKYNALNSTLSEFVKNGTIEQYSEKWCEMQLEIDGVKEAILESEDAVIEFNNALRDSDWNVFNKMQESMGRIPSESNFLIDLMSDEDMHDDKGQLTSHGQATLGIHAIKYNTYMAQADEYAKELLEINKEIADDPNNQTLLERREELLELQRGMITSAEDELQSIKNLYSNGYGKLLDSMDRTINKRKSMLSQMKSAYDYQKSIEKQTKEISNLEKQLLAYRGDTSESSMAITQQLKIQLEEAKGNLSELEWEQQIKEEEKLLDALYDQTSEWINTRLDDLNGIVQSAIDSTNANAENIKATLEAETDEVGIKLSDEMSKILTSNNGMKDVVTMYGDNFGTQITTVNSTLLDIKAVIEGMANASDSSASKVVSSSANTLNGSSVPTTSPPTVVTPANNGSSSNGGEAGWESALVYSEYKGSNSKLNTSTSIVDLLKSHDYSSAWNDRASLYKAMNGAGVYTGSAKQNRFMIDTMKAKGYKKGSSNIPYNQMSWIHDGEVVLKRVSDGGYLTDLTAASKVLTEEQVNNMLNWSKMNPQVLKPNVNIPSMPVVQNRQVQSAPQIHDINMTFELPNVKNTDDFINDMIRSKRFEKLVQEISFGTPLGRNSMNKYRYIK